MRLCRFALDDDVPLTGFFLDDRVVPIDQAIEAFTEAMQLELLIHDSDDLMAMLPPKGASHRAAWELARWIEGLDTEALGELAIASEEVRLLPPVDRPGKVLMLARNYPEHSVEVGDIAAERAETFPYVFMKPASTVIGHGDEVVIPSISPDGIDWECELGVVIGAECKRVSEADALRFVAGYTVLNDVSDRGFRPNPGRKPRERDAFFDWLHGKWHDTFCPMGPCVRSADSLADPQRLAVRLWVDDERMQDGNTAQMIFPVAAIVSFISSIVTLQPGDVIGTGTPSGTGKGRGRFLKPGQVMTAEIEGIGRLVNPVVAELGD
ncbi:fumarylacetoacetate hydrolase family protein [Tautonia sociabilis]|uniref:FAA hydrolase family protein n=1 Tax=Tautonia sociabilis TaxID=2080755 RepID=A0A432ML18_9BACT|nr:fumarylacetoacetate hydrolase family protein [Tautonia sociabilis]RUL88124.1 FAA hydrolase family protein [Tautonia sociabilis]